MKVFLDHNMSPALGRALAALFKGEHEIALLREKFTVNTTDIEWINKLSAEGKWVVISEDRRITRNKAEYNAFRNSRLIGIFLSKGLHKAPVIKKMERLLAVWSVIESLQDTVSGGAMFELGINGHKLSQLKP